MSRQQLVALLANLIANKHLTVAEAKAVLSAFDAGLFDDMTELMAMQESGSDDTWMLALMAVLALLGGRLGLPLFEAQRQRGKTLLRNQFERENNVLAIQVTQRGMAVATWQANLYALIGFYARKMAVAGAGMIPSLAVRLDTDARITDQVPFLRRFSLQMVAQQLLGRPMTTLGVSSRSNLYGGVGWGSWFLGHESGRGGDVGWVSVYHARDDRGTCSNCYDAARRGPYLPSQGPFPGMICRGKGNCRCTRELVYDLAAWQQLTGVRRVAA